MKNEIIIKAEKNSDGNSRIEKFSSILENMDLAYINNIQIKNIKLENNDSSLTYYINYQKNIEIKTKEELLLKDEIDFSDKYQDKKYNINIYKIQNISKGYKLGYKFDLITNNIINNNKKIFLTFIEINNNTNFIRANCTLSINNKYSIKCETNKMIDEYYFLKDYIYFDKNEFIVIFYENYYLNYNLSLIENFESCYIEENTNTKQINSNTKIINNENSSNNSSDNKNNLINIIFYTVPEIIIIIIILIIVFRKGCVKKCKSCFKCFEDCCLNCFEGCEKCCNNCCKKRGSIILEI